jgi:hypothetical protein
MKENKIRANQKSFEKRIEYVAQHKFGDIISRGSEQNSPNSISSLEEEKISYIL